MMDSGHQYFVWLRMNETSMVTRSQANVRQHTQTNNAKRCIGRYTEKLIEDRISHNLVRMKFLIAVTCLTVSVSAFTAMAPRRVGVNSLSVAQQK